MPPRHAPYAPPGETDEEGAMTLVETRCGTVEGIERSGVLQFRGLPFGAPPVGDLRWRPPRPPEPWTGVRPADRFGPMAPQGTSQISLFPSSGGVEADEAGCLTLNVFTPGLDGDPRPVAVWIHGGGFTGGAAREPPGNRGRLSPRAGRRLPVQ